MTYKLIIVGILEIAALMFIVVYSLIKNGKTKHRTGTGINMDSAGNKIESLEEVTDRLIEHLLSSQSTVETADVTSKIYHHLDGIKMALDFLTENGKDSSSETENMRKRLIQCQEAISQALQLSFKKTVDA